MRQINLNLYPPNGYRFRDRDGYVHIGTSWKRVEAMIIDYRARNKFDPGEPWAEMMNQVCSEVPSYCKEQGPFVLRTTTGKDMDLNKYIVEWFGHAARTKRLGHWRRIDDATAARRARICSTCPMQRALSSSCGACITTINNLRRALLDGKKPQHQNLSPCAVTLEDCQSTVHIDLPPNPDPNLPAHCWRRPS